MSRAGIVLLLLVAAGCARTLPDQDRRITEAQPAAKLSVAVLWKDYQSDAAAADRRYWGQAIDITGIVTAIEPSGPPRLVFELEPSQAIEARLLEDRAASILAASAVGERTTLRCYCAGLSGRVILQSCIRP